MRNKWKSNRLLSILLCLCMVLSIMAPGVMAVAASAADGVTVYFVNSSKWSKVNAYVWGGGSGAGWPGTAMTKTGDTVNGFDIYSITFTTAFENIIFNNGSGSQTADLKLYAGQYFDHKTDVWYASLEDMPGVDLLATDVTLAGSFNGWNTTANVFRRNEKGDTVAYVFLDLAENTKYEFKVVNNGNWLSTTTPIKGSVEGLAFTGVNDNATITTVVAGTYVFAWDLTTSKLSVTYPENICSHKEEEIPAVPAACTATGLTAGVKCSLCGEVLVAQEEVPATGHSYEDGVCTGCGFVSVNVYFINSGNWTNVNAYAWISGGAGLAWPGNAMIKTDDMVNGFEIYEIAFDVAFENIIFNNGSDQTDDLELQNGQYYDYAANVWYASLDEVPQVDPLATGAFLTGDFNGWNTQANEFMLDVEGSTIGSVSLELEAGTAYGFKVVANGSWISCATPITGDVEGLIFSGDVQDNATLTTVVAGTYVFTWDVNANALSVTYPENVCSHEEEVIAGYPASCTEPGLTEGLKCSLCGEIFTAQEEIPALGHNFVDGVCTVCGASSHMTIYFQNNWGWSDVSLYFWGSTLEADPSWPGMAMEYYGYDGTYDIYTLVVPSDVDALIINGVKDDGSGERDQTPNITDGYDGVVYYMAWDNGNTVGSLDIADVELVNCKHEEEVIPGNDATCTESGLTEGLKCGLCGEIFTAQEEIPALGHNFVDGVCTVCGASSHMTIYFQNNWGWSNVSLYFWGSSLEADPNWPGIAMEYYSYDGIYDIYTLVVPSDVDALIINGVKNDGSGALDQTPDITDWYDGIVYYMAWDNGNTTGSFDISDLELVNCKHEEEALPGYDATCTEPGLTEGLKCGLCGEIFTAQEEIPALGHNFVDGVCTVCGASSHMTIYFQNNWGWSNVSLYFWGSTLEADPNWPGMAMEYYGYDGTYDIYTLVVPSDVDALIINGVKDDGSGALDQTPDITDWYDGIVYYMVWDNGNTTGSFDIADVELKCKHQEEIIPGYGATCSQTGLTDGLKCGLCGEVFIAQEEIPATGHVFENGLCIYGCGMMYDPTGLRFSGAALVLEADLTVRFAVKQELLEATGYENPYVVFAFNGVDYTVTDYVIRDGKLQFAFENVAPDKMNDTITATLYASCGESTVKCETRDYSVATYCYNILSKYTGAKCDELRTLVVDLLNYGAESQKYSGHNVDALVNAALTEEQKAWGTSENRTLTTVQDIAYATIENPTVDWKCAGLNLVNSIAIRVKISAENVENLSVRVADDYGNVVTSTKFVKTEGGYYVYLDMLAAAQMSEVLYMTVYEGETPVSNTARYSIESYAYSKQDDSDAQLVELVKAMMKYGDSAKAYFGYEGGIA